MATKTLSEQTDVPTLEEIKKKYKDEWILVEVLETDELNRPTKGRLITHSKDKDDIYKTLKNLKEKPEHTYTTYTGDFPKDYAVAFNL